MSYTCDRCGNEFETPIMVESGGEYGGIAHKELASACCEDGFNEQTQFCSCKFAMIIRDEKTDIPFCSQCKKEIDE